MFQKASPSSKPPTPTQLHPTPSPVLSLTLHIALACSYVERDGRWHHVAVTWSAAASGLTKVYWDGLLKAEAVTRKTAPLQPGGALMLGAEQASTGTCRKLKASLRSSHIPTSKPFPCTLTLIPALPVILARTTPKISELRRRLAWRYSGAPHPPHNPIPN
jgi:hypothetical protein